MTYTVNNCVRVTHGVGLAILTPRWMEYALDEKTAPKFAQYGRNVWGLQGDDDMAVAKDAIRKTIAWYQSMDIPMTL
ncbi:iron-containing alcohol dehydrogenase [Weissella confusa]|uniref:Iron-containing alcohol dehydrogenase n=1 Tax=Weissella confusa TaxID=1583 RepID=A0A923NE57_WEICO|nr:iron-containing alcohol dehydrogenase [Weissella confusa]